MNNPFGYAQVNKSLEGFGDIGLGNGYTEAEIRNCPDPDGGNNTEMPTAVPSPFARFDLIKTAFENIKNTGNLKADTSGKIASKSDEKHVSHALDLAEIVFNYFAYDDKLSILKWNKSEELQSLKETHKRFADSLDLYLKLDAQAYNFDKMDNIFLFKYGAFEDNIIGSTSPVTLFCPSAAKKLAGLGIIRPIDKKPYFGDKYLALYERGADFQKWFYALLRYFTLKGIAISNLDKENIGLSIVWDYADKSLKILGKKKDEASENLADINKWLASNNVQDFEEGYKELYESDAKNAPVDILGVGIRVSEGVDFSNSDFVIKSPKIHKQNAVNNNNGTVEGDGSRNGNGNIGAIVTNGESETVPLALQNGFSRPNYIYYGDVYFTPDIVVPSLAKGSWQEKKRKMPGLGSIKGSYVTVSDFLEPYLVRTIYPISKNFLAFDKTDKEARGYLYPLKKEFFEFFSIESLNANKSGTPKISLVFQDDGSAKVSLEIPIKKHNVMFERVYKESNEQPDQNRQDGGVIVTKKFGITVFPFLTTNGIIKTKYRVNPDYRVQFIDSDKETTFSDLEFYSESKSVALKRVDIDSNKKNTRLNKTKGALASSKYYKINDEFDFIQVKMDREIKVLVIPRWKKVSISNSKYTFAVDLGTTNTHIAYKVGNDPSKPFNITGEGNDVQIATLFDETNLKTYEILNDENTLEINQLISKEFVPRTIGKGQDYVFPQRTALAYNTEMPLARWQGGLAPLTESNIPFCYEKMELKGNEILTNLKWRSKDENEDIATWKLGTYLEQIVMLLRNKVLANGGSLNETELIWFYPGSMTDHDRGELERKWNEHFKKYFGKVDNDTRMKSIMESLAPYYAQNEIRFNGANVLSVDIGGGTTDAAVFFDGKLEGLTSFKFAGNALFGDAYLTHGAEKNGFVIRFVKKIEEMLKTPPKSQKEQEEQEDGYPMAVAVLEELKKKQKAEDINAFFFSLENNIEHWAKQQNKSEGDNGKEAYSYSTMIINNGQDLKFLILYFYVALIYHLGLVLESMNRNIKLRFVVFSGNASKILRILTFSNDILTKLTTKVFKHFNLANDNLEIRLAEEPKEATCKGGLNKEIEAVKVGDIMPTVYSCVKEADAETKATFADYVEDSMKGKNSRIRECLMKFHEFFFSLDHPDHMEFSNFFGIDTVVTKYVKNKYESKIDDWLASSVKEELKINKSIETDKPAQETPFFMPLKGIIQDLSFEIANRAYNKKS